MEPSRVSQTSKRSNPSPSQNHEFSLERTLEVFNARPMGSQGKLNCVQRPQRPHSPGRPVPLYMSQATTGVSGIGQTQEDWHTHLMLVDQKPERLRVCYTHIYTCTYTCTCVHLHTCVHTTHVHICTCMHVFLPSCFTHRTRCQVHCHQGPVIADEDTEAPEAQ